MIDKEKILSLSKMEGIRPNQEEKRYVYAAVLSAIYGTFTTELILKGGTYLYMFHGLNRFSEDLDFTMNGDVDACKLKDAVSERLSFMDIKHEVREKKGPGLNISIAAKGPLYDKPLSTTNVRLEISKRKDMYMGYDIVEAYPKYPDILPFTLAGMKLEEVLAEKVRAIMKRDYARDLYDAYFLLKKGVKPDFELIKKKMGYYNEGFDPELFRAKCEEEETRWKSEMPYLIIGNTPDFKNVLEYVRERIRV